MLACSIRGLRLVVEGRSVSETPLSWHVAALIPSQYGFGTHRANERHFITAWTPAYSPKSDSSVFLFAGPNMYLLMTSMRMVLNIGIFLNMLLPACAYVRPVSCCNADPGISLLGSTYIDFCSYDVGGCMTVSLI